MRHSAWGFIAGLLMLAFLPRPGGADDATAPPPPPGPFSLRVSLPTPDAVVGQTVKVTYRLTNDTEEAINGCADDWSAGVWWGRAGIRGTPIQTAFNCPASGHFRLSSHATRTWTSEVKVLNVGLGDGRFVGVVRTTGETWSGEVRSPAIPVIFRDPHGG
ncbi:MAG TPA: hypothetical protein VFQ07_14980 [Candidatus Polarisedimenticolia bacterium]|nr:hypothetical protein [Candidatus Polarisedimenticolia bacterium]